MTTMTDDELRYRLRGHVSRLEAQLGHETLASREQLRLADALAEAAAQCCAPGGSEMDGLALDEALAAYRAARMHR